MCWRHAGTFAAAALPGILAGTALANAVSGQALLAGFAVLMLLAAVATWRKVGAAPDRAPAAREPTCPPLRLARNRWPGP